MKIRKLHRITAIAFAPLFILLSASGCALLFRKSGAYSKEIKSFLVSVHTWEIIAPYIGIIGGLGLLTVVVTGIIIFFKRNAKADRGNRKGHMLSMRPFGFNVVNR